MEQKAVSELSSTVDGLKGANAAVRSAMNCLTASARLATGDSGAHGSRLSMQDVASSRAVLTSLPPEPPPP